MATTTKPKGRRRAGPPGGADARKALDEAMQRVTRSIDAAEGRQGPTLRCRQGPRDLVRDLERTLTHARSNARRVGKAISKDPRGGHAAHAEPAHTAQVLAQARVGSLTEQKVV